MYDHVKEAMSQFSEAEEVSMIEIKEGSVALLKKRKYPNLSNPFQMAPGWTEHVHRIGKPFYVHTESHAVSWSKPYILEDLTDCENHMVDPRIFQAEKLHLYAHSHEFMEQGVSRDFRLKKVKKLRDQLLCECNRVEKILSCGQRGGVLDSASTILTGQRLESPSSLKDGKILVYGIDVSEPYGKPPLGFLQEWCSRKNIGEPEIDVEENIGAECEAAYTCTITIGGVLYAQAHHQNKKYSRYIAAEQVLEKLLPGFWKGLQQAKKVPTYDNSDAVDAPSLMKKFNSFKITDPEVYEIANALSIKTPKQLVQEYQNRNPGRAIRREIVEGASGGFNCLFYIDEKVAAMAEGKKKKDAEQFAAQKLLEHLHPDTTLYQDVIGKYKKALSGRGSQRQGKKLAERSPRYQIASTLVLNPSSAAEDEAKLMDAAGTGAPDAPSFMVTVPPSPVHGYSVLELPASNIGMFMADCELDYKEFFQHVQKELQRRVENIGELAASNLS